MHINFSPVRRDMRLTLSRTADILTINGVVFDFTPLPDGATLPRQSIDSDWIAGDVTRTDGILSVPLILPHGADAPDDTRFPAPMTLTGDGPVILPPHDQEIANDH